MWCAKSGLQIRETLTVKYKIRKGVIRNQEETVMFKTEAGKDDKGELEIFGLNVFKIRQACYCLS